MIRPLRPGLCALLLLCLSTLPALADDRYEAARTKYHALLAQEQTGWSAAAWRKTARAFEKALSGERGDDALYMVALCYERAHRLSVDEADLVSALHHYERLEQEYPSSSLADDALFRAARLYENRGRLTKARARYQRLLDRHIDGDMAELARKRMAELGKGVEVLGVRSWSGPSYTRVVLDLSGLAEYEVKSLPANPEYGKPPRFYVDLQRTRVGAQCTDCLTVSDGLVTKVRLGQFDKETARMVLDLQADATYRVFPLLSPERLVIDVFRSEGAGQPVAKEMGKPEETGDDVVARLIEQSKTGQGSARPKAGPDATTKPAVGKRKLRIVIDPGHGGKDPGAVGVGGLYEKAVTLALSKELRRQLKARLDCDIKLTRETDVTLSLAQRTAIANAYGADLFISIHANASRSRKARGVETYYLDRASDRSARKVAAKENKTSEAGVRETEAILADVLLNMKLPESKRLARAIQTTMVSNIAREMGPVRDLGVKRAPFYVLTGAVMPAVLVEAAFISNPTEAKWLKSEKFRRTVARSLTDAVVDYTNSI